MPFTQAKGGKSDPNGSGRVWIGTVVLSSGSTTISYADLPGVTGELPAEPAIVATGQSAGVGIAVTSSGTSQAVIDDGSGSSTDTANVLIHEQGGD